MYRVEVSQKPGLLGRILLGIAALGIVVIGFFFLTIALVAGAILALVIGVRLWWTMRKLKRDMAAAGSAPGGGDTRAGGSEALEGDYQVVERESGNEKLPQRDS
jgi:predicted lipid-binding transport protein (Tim44 family)